MDDTSLVSSLRANIAASDGNADSELSNQRAEAMRYYLGEPLGNEVEGRSQVVTSEVSDTVEWILPQLLKIFSSTSEVVRLDPVGPEDEDAADQETDYLNYIFYKENDGFDVLYTWFKDALLSKNGIIKYYYEDTEESSPETYMSLTPDELAMLVDDEDIEVKNVEEQEDGTYNVNIIRSERSGKIVIRPIPPEEFLIASDFDGHDLQECDFCAHETTKTISQLRVAGYDSDKIDEIVGYYENSHLSSDEYTARFDEITSALGMAHDDEQADPSMRRVRITECVKRVDYDGDGIAELRKITLANETVILENEEIGYVPFEAITPIPMTHRFFGRSIADLVIDLQKIKSTLLRNILDNMYLINNARTAIVDGEVNIEDLLDSRPGGVVRMTAPGMANPLPTQPFTGHAFGMLEYMDTLRENRTGVTRYSQGMDSNSLNKTATGIDKIMTASQERVHLIARIFGNGLKRLLLGVHRLALQNMDKEKVIKLRGQWVPVNPSEWRTRENMSVTVGLGTGDKEKQKESLAMIMQLQRQAIEMGGKDFVEPKHILYAFKKFIEASGYQDSDQFFNDPNTVPWPPQQQPDPQQMLIQAQMQIEQQKAQIAAQRNQTDAQIAARELQLKEQAMQMDMQKNAQRLALDQEKAAIKAQLDAVSRKLQETETMLSNASGDKKLALDKYKADLNAETQILLKQMDVTNRGNEPEPDYSNQIVEGLNRTAETLESIETRRYMDREKIAEYLRKNGSPEIQGVVDDIED